MKGDFTRFTFQPQKHYSSVLMQQGRLQLDADWNEQMSILNYLNQIQTQDIIGSAAGTSAIGGGYQIRPATSNNSTTSNQPKSPITDLLITDGRFYIDGILCELNRGTAIAVEWRSDKQILVPTITLDGRLFAPNQWVELEIPEEDNTIQIKLNKIVNVSRDSFTLDFQEQIPQPQEGSAIKLRLLTTYKTQADYTSSATLSPEAIHIVYLDVWQRHVTALDDRQLLEVALNGLDTTTRLKTMAQVKLLDITKDLTAAIPNLKATKLASGSDTKLLFKEKPSLSDLITLPIWTKLTTRSVSMTATTASDPENAIDTSGSYQGSDHRLYRVEIHKEGTIDKAIFKWSRDNGSIVSAIAKIEGDVVYLKASIQDEYKLFGSQSSSQSQENPWVEIITEAHELDNQPGILVQVRDVKPPNLLLLNMSQVQGTSVPKVNLAQAEEQKWKVRRWDGQSGTNSNWQVLEPGIQVQFTAEQNSTFKTGDYWLISARANQPLDWPRDLPQAKQQLGQPIAQPPAGIEHHYGILAVVKTQEQDGTIIFSSAVDNDDQNWTQSDLRTKFLPLIERSNSSGIGVQPEARLHVKGDNEQTAIVEKIQVTSNSTNSKVRITGIKAQIFKGYTVTIGKETKLVTEVDRGADYLELTLLEPFTDVESAEKETSVSYQQPVIRFETNAASVPQFFLNTAGNIGINTFNPSAQFELRGIKTELPTDILQIKNADETSLLNVGADGKVGIGIDLPQANLDVKDVFRVTNSTDSSAFLQIKPQAENSVEFVSKSGYSFDKNIAVKEGGLTVQNGGASISGLIRLINAQNGITIASGGISVEGETTISVSNHKLNVNESGTTITGIVTLKNDDNNRISLDNTGTTVTGIVTLKNNDNNRISLDNTGTTVTGNLTIANGTLTVGSFTLDDKKPQFNKLTVREEITFGNEKKKITLSHSSNTVTVNLIEQTTLSVQSGTKRLIELLNSSTPNSPKLNISGDVVIGSESSGDLLAKLQVQGISKSENDAALNVTDSGNQSLFCVRNNGFVNIGTNDNSVPTLDSIPQTETTTAKLYVKGNTFIDGKLFAKNIKGTSIEQVSSRTLKENINNLSSQEAAAMLKQLNPVKFNYTFSGDRTLHTGFIAEEVPELLASADRQAVLLLDLVAVLTKTVKDQREEMFLLSRVVRQQQAAIAALTQKVTQLENESI